MIDAMVTEMKSLFRKGVFAERTSFYFTLDDSEITVILDAESYSAEQGKTVQEPDCSCKTATEMFRRIWYDGYRPGIMDFLGGAIKSDAPLMLPQFLKSFGK